MPLAPSPSACSTYSARSARSTPETDRSSPAASRSGRSRTRTAAGVGVLVTGSLLLQAPASAAAPPAAPPAPGQSVTQAPQAGPERGVLVVGHRGASGYRPEHTLASYALAIRLGADYIEPDLVSTRDGVLVARHENLINDTTDVASRAQFADRRTAKVVDGVRLAGWFTEDFTLAELKTLRAKERIPLVRQRNTLYDGRYQVPTLREVLRLVRRESRRTGRAIGVYPETKHPTYFDGIGLSLEEPLLRELARFGYDDVKDKVFVQSFETANLKELDRRTDVRLVQLYGDVGQPYDVVAAGGSATYDSLSTRQGLRRVARYADGVGPNKARVIPVGPDGAPGEPTAFVRDAHRVDLQVHPYTFRNENTFLPPALRKGTDPAAYGDAFAEYEAFFAAGVDGVFSDNPDTARAARDEAPARQAVADEAAADTAPADAAAVG